MNIIEFSHPGRQVSIGTKADLKRYSLDTNKTTGVRYWNYEDHYRKFLCHNAKVAGSNEFKKMTFWGEFEPCSNFKKLKGGSNTIPNSVHFPFYSFPRTDIKQQNTDPFVWTPDKYYALCKQRSAPIVRNLKDYSILLFGTEYPKGYAVDTVFVVKKSYLTTDVLNNKIEVDQDYMKYSYELMKRSDFNEQGEKAKTDPKVAKYFNEYRVYEALRYEDDQEIFTFVPGKFYDEKSQVGHERLYLDYKTWNLQKPGAGTVLYRIKDIAGNINHSLDYTKGFFKALLEETKKQGFEIIVDLEKVKETNDTK